MDKKKAYLIKTTWQYATFSPLHTAYFFAWNTHGILEVVTKLRGMQLWKMNDQKIGIGWSGQALIMCDFYVLEIEL